MGCGMWGVAVSSVLGGQKAVRLGRCMERKASWCRGRLAQSLSWALLGAGVIVLSACASTKPTAQQAEIYEVERLGGNELAVRPRSASGSSLGVYNHTLSDTAVGAEKKSAVATGAAGTSGAGAASSSSQSGGVAVLAAQCRAGDGNSCETMARDALQEYETSGDSEDLKSAIMLATSACAYKPKACMLKGDLFYRAYKDGLDIESFLPGRYVRDEITSAYSQATDAKDLTLAADAYYKLGEVYTEFKRPKNAATNFSMSCKVGGSAYCAKAASALKASGQTKLAASTFAKACELGDTQSCLDYGEQLYTQGATAKANALYQKACDGKEGAACRILGQRYMKAKGVKKALALWDQGCAAGDGMSCSLAAGYEVRVGKFDTALRNFEQGCSLGNATACQFVADYALHQGKVSAAMSKLSTACSTNNAGACYTLGLLQTQAQAQESFDKACKLEHKGACNALASSFSSTSGDAIAAYEKSCKLGNSNSCLQWGMALAANKQSKGAVEALTKACDLKNPSACERLGVLYIHEQKAAEAATVYRKACALNSAVGCTQLGLSYAEGTGVKKSASQAVSFFAKACKLGSADACVVSK